MATNTNRKVLTLFISIVMIVLGIIGLAQNVYAEDISFIKNAVTFRVDEEYPEVGVDTDIGIEKGISSNESVATISNSGYSYASLEIKGVGKTTITAIDYDGHSASCAVTITEDDWYLEKTSVEALVTEDYIDVDIKSGENNSYTATSSNTKVATVETYDNGISIIVGGVGTSTITVTDKFGKSEACEVTIKEDDWYLEKTSAEALVTEDNVYINVESGGNNFFTATSSNTKVARVETFFDEITINVGEVGTSIITVTDKFGKSATCTFTVKPEPLELDPVSLKLDAYDEEDYTAIYSKGEYTKIVSAESSNTKVVKAKVEKDEDYEDYYVAKLKPISAGDAIITIKDQYGQTATAPITITQKYIDESKYLEDLISSSVENMEYRDTKMYISTDIDLNVYTIIDGKTYTGSIDEDGYYVIKGIPILPAGTKLTVYMSKGQAKYQDTVTIEKKRGADLSAKIKTQVYTGKALKPAVTVKHGKYILKKGTDYTVKYSNNKKIGKAKATLTFKGNYKGANAVYFTIGPKGTSISKLTPIRTGFKIKWKKRTANVSGYQIQYSENKADIAYGYKETVNNNKITSVKVTDLWGEKYYVRIRTFKKVGSKKYYSAWSKIKSVSPKW